MNKFFLDNQASAIRRIAWFGFLPQLLSLGNGIANAETDAPMEAPATLSAVDFNFVGQANLGAPFQVDSGRLAENKGGTVAIRNYAHLMVTTHIPVANALTAILQGKSVSASNALLHGADARCFRRSRQITALRSPRLCERPSRVSKGKCYSDRRFGTTATVSSSNSGVRLCRRSRIICSEP